MHLLTWAGIFVCLSQSAMLSGLNLAVFGVSRLKLEVEASMGDADAVKVLELRRDSNYTLTTILWGNVGVNVLLTLLSDSVLAGVGAFFFSTFVITLAGEIIPQAYFSRRALRVAAMLSKVLRIYRVVLFPVAWPTANLLDWWLGPEGITYFRERGLREVIKKHIEADEAEIDMLEGIGAMNFLAMDDLLVVQEGEPVDPKSVINLPITGGRPVFPTFSRTPDDPFLKSVHLSGRKWVIITGPDGEPAMMLDCDGFLRASLFAEGAVSPFDFCHRPIIVRDMKTKLGKVLSRLRYAPVGPHDDVIDQDAVLVWGDQKRVITGADILGRLMRGIALREPVLPGK
jgi:metal transporter CNNM